MLFKYNLKIFWSYYKVFLGVWLGVNLVVFYNSVVVEKLVEKVELFNNYFCFIFCLVIFVVNYWWFVNWYGNFVSRSVGWWS